MNKIFAGIVAALLVTAAYAQNAGTVTNHAYAIGKGAGVAGYTSLLCASGQLALGSATDPTCRTMSGDATLSATGVLTLATVNANVGTFGSATQAPQVTLDAKGRATAATSLTVTPAVGSITGLGTGVGAALAVNVGTAGAFVVNGGALGTPSSGVGTNLTALNASSITLGTLATARLASSSITLAGQNCVLGSTCGLSSITNSVVSSMTLNSSVYVAGPTVAQGSTGTWFASGNATLTGNNGDQFTCRMSDGTTVIDSGTVQAAGDLVVSLHLSGFLASPASNLQILCLNVTGNRGTIASSNGVDQKASTISAFRIN